MAVTKPTTAQQAMIDQAVQAALAEAQKGLVAAVSKPDQIANLRNTWRKSGEHLAEQLKRFVRLTVLAAIPAAGSLLFSKHFDTQTLLAFILPFAETAFRQVFPAMGAASVDSAPGVTIVPDQVADPATPVVAPVDPVVVPDPVVPAADPGAPVVPEGDAAP